MRYFFELGLTASFESEYLNGALDVLLYSTCITFYFTPHADWLTVQLQRRIFPLYKATYPGLFAALACPHVPYLTKF